METKYFSEPKQNHSWHELIAALLIGVTLGVVPGAWKVESMKKEVAVAVSQTGKEIADLRQQKADLTRTAVGWQQMHDECNKTVIGDGTKTVIHGRAPDEAWIINRAVTPSLAPGASEGAGVYERVHSNGAVDGPFLIEPSRMQSAGNQ